MGMTNKQLQILATYDMYDDNDISTERLLAMVCDSCNCDVEEVIDALIIDGRSEDGNGDR